MSYRIAAAVPLLAVSLCASVASVVAADSAVMEFTLADTEKVVERARPTKPSSDALAEDVTAQMRGLRWGMSAVAVSKHLRARLKEVYLKRIRSEPDVLRQDALFQQLRQRARELSRKVEFAGRITGWDISPIADEFRHGSHESMLVVRHDDHRAFYFFIDDRLWKVYREYQPATLGAEDFAGLAEALTARWGRGELQQRPRAKGSRPSRWVQWRHAGTRVSALDRGAEVCLLLENEKTLDQLALLRKNAKPRHSEDKHAVVDSVVMSDQAREELHSNINKSTTSPLDKYLKD